MKQISVFVENKPGRAAGIIAALAAGGINLRALSIADTSDYGILRMITDKPDEALRLVKEYGSIVKITEVLAVAIDDKPGGLSSILKIFADHDILLSYLYAFGAPLQGHAVVVVKVDRTDAAFHALLENGIDTVE